MAIIQLTAAMTMNELVAAQNSNNNYNTDVLHRTGDETATGKKTLLLALSADADAASHKIINLATPTLDTDAATKAYVDSGSAVSKRGIIYKLTSPDYTLNDSTATLIPFNAKLARGLADDSLYTVSAGSITINQAGIYRITLGAFFPAMAAGKYLELSAFLGAAQVLIESATSLADQSAITSSPQIFEATAGSVLTCKALQKSGNAVTIFGSSYTYQNRLIIEKLQ